MADVETEKEWEKSKRIEAERMKAARAIAEEKPDKTKVAFLDPSVGRKGWSNDSNAILKSAEKIGNRSIIFAVCGVVLGIIGTAGSLVSVANKLGMAGAFISTIPTIISMFGIGIAFLMAIVTIGCELYFKLRNGRQFSAGIWSAVGTIVVIVIHSVLRWLIVR